MKRNLKKIMSVLLTIIMVMALIPTMAFAATEIDYVEIDGVTVPEVGEAADFNWSVPKKADYSKYVDEVGDSCFWVETGEIPAVIDDYYYDEWIYESSDTELIFQEDMYYTFGAIVIADDGVFAENTYATINGEEAKVVVDEENLILVWCTFDCYGNPVYSNAISSIDVNTYYEPEVDESLDFYWEIWNAGYSAFYDECDDSCAWVETDEAPESYEDVCYGTWFYESEYDGEYTFQEGKYYTFVAYCLLDDGYELADYAYASLNGNYADIETLDDGVFAVWATFGPLQPFTYIDTVEISGVTAPVVGECADFYYEIPEDAGYYMDIDEDGDCCAWVETDEEPTCYSDLENGVWAYSSGYGDIEINFQEGKYYTFVAHVVADYDYDYKFSNLDVYACFNGELFDANVELLSGYEATIWKTFTPEGEYNYGEVYGLDVNDEVNLKYKDTFVLDCNVWADENAEYTVEFSSDDDSVCSVNEYGELYAAGRGTTTITTTVIDSNGYAFIDTTEVTVKFSFWQWIVNYILFGWVWGF